MQGYFITIGCFTIVPASTDKQNHRDFLQEPSVFIPALVVCTCKLKAHLQEDTEWMQSTGINKKLKEAQEVT